MNACTYAELNVTSNFSFLRGASHPQEYVKQAGDYGLHAIGIADRNTLAGVVRAYRELQNEKLIYKPRLLVGARLVFVEIAYLDGAPDTYLLPLHIAPAETLASASPAAASPRWPLRWHCCLCG